MSGYAAYTKESLEAFLPDYLQRLSQRRPGRQRIVVGKPQPDQTRGCTIFVVRVSDRREVFGDHIQRSKPGERYNRYSSRYYKSVSVSYVVAQYTWDTGRIVELSAHPTKTLALAAIKP